MSAINNSDGYFTRKRVVKPVKLPDGSTAYVRKLSEGATDELRQKFSDDTKALEGMRFVVLNTLANESGERILKPDDMEKLREIDNDEIIAIAEAALDFTGIRKPVDPKAAPANSPETTSA